MRKYIHFILILVVCGLYAGCSKNSGYTFPNENGYGDSITVSPRLIINGLVTDTSGEPIEGIYVAVLNVREENEPDILTYNYSITDSLGQCTIIRYRGREYPAEITVVATDSTGIYPEQYRFAPVTYDSVYNTKGVKMPFNGYATVNFKL